MQICVLTSVFNDERIGKMSVHENKYNYTM